MIYKNKRLWYSIFDWYPLWIVWAMWFGVSNSIAGETGLKGFSRVAGILDGFLRITGLLVYFLWTMRWLGCFLQADWVLDCPLWATGWLDCSLWADWILDCPLWATGWLNCSLWDRAGLGETLFILTRFSWSWSSQTCWDSLKDRNSFSF